MPGKINLLSNKVFQSTVAKRDAKVARHGTVKPNIERKESMYRVLRNSESAPPHPLWSKNRKSLENVVYTIDWEHEKWGLFNILISVHNSREFNQNKLL